MGLKIGEGLKLMDVDVVGLKILDHWLSLVLDRWVSNRELLWFCVWIIGLLLKMDWWVCVCFLADFWVCVFFCVWLTRKIYCRVCVCVIVGDWFVFLYLADKIDLLLGLCLCSCWRSVCVFVFGWQERSTAGFVFVFLLEIGLCFCVWLTRKGKKILENLGMFLYLKFGFVFLLFLFKTHLDFNSYDF